MRTRLLRYYQINYVFLSNLPIRASRTLRVILKILCFPSLPYSNLRGSVFFTLGILYQLLLCIFYYCLNQQFGLQSFAIFYLGFVNFLNLHMLIYLKCTFQDLGSLVLFVEFQKNPIVFNGVLLIFKLSLLCRYLCMCFTIFGGRAYALILGIGCGWIDLACILFSIRCFGLLLRFRLFLIIPFVLFFFFL